MMRVSLTVLKRVARKQGITRCALLGTATWQALGASPWWRQPALASCRHSHCCWHAGSVSS